MRSVKSPSTPRSSSRFIWTTSLIVQMCTSRPAAWNREMTPAGRDAHAGAANRHLHRGHVAKRPPHHGGQPQLRRDHGDDDLAGGAGTRDARQQRHGRVPALAIEGGDQHAVRWHWPSGSPPRPAAPASSDLMSMLNRASGNASSSSASVEKVWPSPRSISRSSASVSWFTRTLRPAVRTRFGVVREHGDAVLARVNVGLEVGRARGERLHEREQGVFGRINGEAPVGEQARKRRLEPRGPRRCRIGLSSRLFLRSGRRCGWLAGRRWLRSRRRLSRLLDAHDDGPAHEVGPVVPRSPPRCP